MVLKREKIPERQLTKASGLKSPKPPACCSGNGLNVMWKPCSSERYLGTEASHALL